MATRRPASGQSAAKPAVSLPRRQLEPIDPDSEVGREACRVLGEVFDAIAERLRREGKPVPDCIA